MTTLSPPLGGIGRPSSSGLNQTPTTTTSPVTTALLSHAAPRYTFSFTPFLQRTYQHSLPADRPICKAYQSGNCPLRSHCPERHVSSTPSNNNNPSGGGGGGPMSFGSLVCKHWLRGLCKKGESCEFLHEYNLRKMPECNFFVRNGYCSNGDECLYLHIDPQSKLPPCPHYDRGFCPLGPRCDKKHVRRKLCPFYLAGFCPEGARMCKEGTHARWTRDADMEKPRVRQEKVDGGDGMGAGGVAGGGGDHQHQIFGNGPAGNTGGGLLSERDREQRDIQAGHDRGSNRGDREGGGGHDGQGGRGGRGDRFGGGGRGRGWRGRGGKYRGRGGHDRGQH